MTTAKEYREFADECLGWAKTAKSDREKRLFLQMTETWLQAAVIAENSDRTGHNGHAAPIPKSKAPSGAGPDPQ